MPLKCDNCGASVTLTDTERRKLAGKFFACPECGTSMRVPEASPSSRRTMYRLAMIPTAIVLLATTWLVSGRESSGQPVPRDGNAAVAAAVPPAEESLTNEEDFQRRMTKATLSDDASTVNLARKMLAKTEEDIDRVFRGSDIAETGDMLELIRQRRSPRDLVRLSIMRRHPGSGGFDFVRWWPPRDVKTSELGVVQACRMTYRVKNKFSQAKGDVIAIVRNDIIHEAWDFGKHDPQRGVLAPNKTAEEILSVFDSVKN